MYPWLCLLVTASPGFLSGSWCLSQGDGGMLSVLPSVDVDIQGNDPRRISWSSKSLAKDLSIPSRVLLYYNILLLGYCILRRIHLLWYPLRILCRVDTHQRIPVLPWRVLLPQVLLQAETSSDCLSLPSPVSSWTFICGSSSLAAVQFFVTLPYPTCVLDR